MLQRNVNTMNDIQLGVGAPVQIYVNKNDEGDVISEAEGRKMMWNAWIHIIGGVLVAGLLGLSLYYHHQMKTWGLLTGFAFGKSEKIRSK